MTTKQPYVSVDIETTGLDPDYCQILEVGAVIDDWVTPIGQLPTFHCYVIHDRIVGQPFALAMNAAILKRIAEKSEEPISQFVRPEAVGRRFQNWLAWHYGDPHYVLATGKNFAGFDLQFLRRLPSFSDLIRFHHRSIDPGTLYWQPGEEPPSTKVCMERAGIPGEVAHTAVQDAITVVKLVRYAAASREPTGPVSAIAALREENNRLEQSVPRQQSVPAYQPPDPSRLCDANGDRLPYNPTITDY